MDSATTPPTSPQITPSSHTRPSSKASLNNFSGVIFFLMVEHFKNPFRIILWFVCFRDLDSQNLYCFSRQIKEVGRGLFLPNSDEKGTLIKTLPEHFFCDDIPTPSSFPQNKQSSVFLSIQNLLCAIVSSLKISPKCVNLRKVSGRLSQLTSPNNTTKF